MADVASEPQVDQHLRFMAHHLFKERAVEFAADKPMPAITAHMMKKRFGGAPTAKNSTNTATVAAKIMQAADEEDSGLTTGRYERTIAQIQQKRNVENPEVEVLDYKDLCFKDRFDGFDSVHASQYSDLSLELARTYEDTNFESVTMPERHAGMVEPSRDEVDSLTGAGAAKSILEVRPDTA